MTPAKLLRSCLRFVPPIGSAGLRRCCVAAVLLIGLMLAAAAPAQSLDPQKPAPLAPGVNRGNVDNMAGSHYYYFFAGPGHFDVRLGFRDLGLFGNPLRQTLAIDFYDDDAKLTSHNSIAAQGQLECITTDGDFDKRQRVRLAVVPQSGAVKLGGYYEIEITGAAELPGKQGATAGVKPVDTRLVFQPGAAPPEAGPCHFPK
jgi:hypothetical protein